MDFCLLATGAFRLHLAQEGWRASQSRQAETWLPESALPPLDQRLLARLARAQPEQPPQRPYCLGNPAGVRP
jgi:hypothetical protein